MGLRLANKTALIVGAGQTPGDSIGNGRAISVLFARHGASLMLADRNLDSAEETRSMIEGEGGVAATVEADVTSAEDCARMVRACLDTYGRIDIVVHVVGIGEGDRRSIKVSREDWDHILTVNLTGFFLTCKQVIPAMEEQGGGSIIAISSAAAVASQALTAYKTSKAGMNALVHHLAMRYAGSGIRVNAIALGLLETPMAIEGISKARGMDKPELIALRNEAVPLRGGMGDAWDTAHAALYLASDEAKFVTAVILPVDGGQSAKIG
jgi:NAD(P)-dependent dehydrogenase (short-subunit alcohol dehydrogenase family)